MNNQRLQEIWNQGYADYLFHIRVSCPYDKDDEAQAWQDGFNQAMKDD